MCPWKRGADACGNRARPRRNRPGGCQDAGVGRCAGRGHGPGDSGGGPRGRDPVAELRTQGRGSRPLRTPLANDGVAPALGDPWSGPAPLPGRKPVCGAAAAGPPPSPGEGLGRSHAPRRRRQCADAPGRRRRPRCALAVAAPHIDAGDALDRKRLLRSAAHAGLAVLSPGGEWLGRARGPKQGTRASRSGLRGWTGVFPPTAPGRGALRRAAPGLVAGLAPRSRARRRPLGPLPAGPVLAPSDATRGPGAPQAPQPTGGMRPWRHGRTSC